MGRASGTWDQREALEPDAAQALRDAFKSGTPGRLTVHVHEAAQLRAADTNGRSDPYVLVKPGGYMGKRTRCVLRSLAPAWNQDLSFDGPLVGFCLLPLKLKVFDRDILSLNDPLGSVAVSLDGFRGEGAASQLTNGLGAPRADGQQGNHQVRRTLHFVRRQLESSAGVPCKEGSTLSFSVSFELTAQRFAFPAAPTHASTLQALSEQTPPTASRLERVRDPPLRRGPSAWHSASPSPSPSPSSRCETARFTSSRATPSSFGWQSCGRSRSWAGCSL